MILSAYAKVNRNRSEKFPFEVNRHELGFPRLRREENFPRPEAARFNWPCTAGLGLYRPESYGAGGGVPFAHGFRQA